jgi:hypothetical protein
MDSTLLNGSENVPCRVLFSLRGGQLLDLGEPIPRVSRIVDTGSMSPPDKNIVGRIRGLGSRPVLIPLQNHCWKQAVAARHFAKAGHERVSR